MKITWSGLLKRVGPFLGLLALILFFAIGRREVFFTRHNFYNVFRQNAPLLICAVGMTFVIISGAIDLSVGSAATLAMVATALAYNATRSMALAVAAGTGCGALCGLLNGTLVSALKLPPFIVTLGTMGIIRGVALISTNAVRVSGKEGLEWLAEKSFWSVPLTAVIMLAVAIAAHFTLKRTRLGRYTYAIGSNEPTARLCGVNIALVKCLVFALAGVAYGLAGAIQSSRLAGALPTENEGLELHVIAAVVIGGGSLMGGEGNIMGSVIGVFIIAFLRNGCNIMGVSKNWEYVVIGATIVIAVVIDRFRHIGQKA